MSPEIVRRLVQAAYDEGWSDACADHMDQRRDPESPIGKRRARQVADIVGALDPRDLLGLRETR